MEYFINVESREDFILLMCQGRLLISCAAFSGAKSIARLKGRVSYFLRIRWQDVTLQKSIRGSMFQRVLGPCLLTKFLKVQRNLLKSGFSY